MRKLLCAILCALLILTLCACAKENLTGLSVGAVDYDYGDGSAGKIPQVSGMANKSVMHKINNEIKLALTEKYESIRDESLKGKTSESYDFDIVGALLIIKSEGDYYVPNAAHGLPYRSYLHFNLIDGARYEVESALRGEGAAEKLRDILEDKLQKKLGADWLTYGVPMKEAMFTLSGQNIRVVFPPYSVAAYSVGFVEIDIPFTDFDGFLDYDAPVIRAYMAR